MHTLPPCCLKVVFHKIIKWPHMLFLGKENMICNTLEYLWKKEKQQWLATTWMIILQHMHLDKCLTLDISLRPRSIRGGGFLSKMPASYGETMAGLMNRRNMALPTAPMLFWGNRWLTTCMDTQWMEDVEGGKKKKGKNLGKEERERKTGFSAPDVHKMPQDLQKLNQFLNLQVT